MKFISLGGNCSITYQLNKYNLRKEAYPFDWCKININQLIKVLENNFDEYSETLIIKYKSNKHFKDNESSYILKNIYNIKFSHEIIYLNELEKFIKSINRRIERFKNLTEKIIFIRIELSPIKISYENNIKNLIKLLYKYSNNFELLLIINLTIQLNLPNNVKIYKFNEFSENWKMDNINWNQLFLSMTISST